MADRAAPAPEPISWEMAEKVAIRVAGREPLASSYHYDSLGPDFTELTALAEELVAEATGLRSLVGPARARVTDREGWVRANIASFRRLLRPLTDKLGPKLSSSPLAPVSRAVTGAQLGTMLGWMSSRVLGQYDLLLVEEERPEDQDIVYYVGPNVLALEKRFGFPPREFRLWLALHEVTHRCQFTGITWLRPHFLSLVEGTLDSVDPDPKRFLDALRKAVDEMRAGRNPLAEGGIVGLLASPEQQALLHQVGGLMSLLEGHGDVTMDRAGAGRIPSASRFSKVLHQRRAEVRGPARLLQQLIGLEAKMKQYEQGERFIEAVEAAGGPELFERVWQGPEWLPDLSEIQEPSRWIERATTGAPAAAS
ncbi:MAG TPA: zinc-dependent metalloprotease [Acidimicrobiales bacterium]|nr:zinc-dependent metalloprotease [Acidimicrobiales bacterium]